MIKNHIEMFADDPTISTVFPSVKSRLASHHSLQSDLDSVASWADKWLVQFNARKTQLMTISRKIKKPNLPGLRFLDETLGDVSSIKLL